MRFPSQDWQLQAVRGSLLHHRTRSCRGSESPFFMTGLAVRGSLLHHRTRSCRESESPVFITGVAAAGSQRKVPSVDEATLAAAGCVRQADPFFIAATGCCRQSEEGASNRCGRAGAERPQPGVFDRRTPCLSQEWQLQAVRGRRRQQMRPRWRRAAAAGQWMWTGR